jgi:hypothetical protein
MNIKRRKRRYNLKILPLVFSLMTNNIPRWEVSGDLMFVSVIYQAPAH